MEGRMSRSWTAGIAIACITVLVTAISWGNASATPARASAPSLHALAISHASARATTRFLPGAPEKGTAIPQVNVTFGLRPYADNSFEMIPTKKGWFKHVGINVVPPPYGIKDSDNAIALMLKGQVDVQAMFGPTLVPTMKTSNHLKMFAFTDLFTGWAILANPNLHLKPVGYYMNQGMSFAAAMHKTLAPVAGKTLVVAPLVDARGFDALAFKIAGIPEPSLQVLDDSKSLELAKARRVDLATPTGAPITLSFEHLGYVPLVTPIDILKNVPGNPQGQAEELVATVGMASNDSYINRHPNTILRITGVLWKTISKIQTHPAATLSVYPPYLNSVAGTNLKWNDIQEIFAKLDPLSNFAFQANYCVKKGSTFYYKNAYSAILRSYVKQGLIPSGFSPDDVIWTCQVYDTMVRYKRNAERLFARLSGQSLTASRRQLLRQARAFHADFDFLDAYRYALAASVGR